MWSIVVSFKLFTDISKFNDLKKVEDVSFEVIVFQM